METRRSPDFEPNTGAPPVSWHQRRLWYLDQLYPGNPAYNTPYAMRIEGDLDQAALERALHAVTGRQKLVRTVYPSRQGSPFPVLLPKWSVELKRVDLRYLPLAERDAAAQRSMYEEARVPFNLARELKLRVLQVQLSDREYYLLLNSHHIIFERGSVGVLYRDLACFYDAWVSGSEPEPAPLKAEYSDFVAWQNARLESPHLEELTNYWKQALAGAPLIALPLDRSRPAIHNMSGHRHYIRLPAALIRSAGDLFRASKLSNFRGLLTVFNVFLYGYTGMTDLSIGSPVSPPDHLGFNDLIGFFANTVVLRTRFSPEMSFRQLMGRVDGVVREAVKHSDLPFDRIVDAVRPPRESGRGPLFQVNFRAPREPYPRLQLKGIIAGPTILLDNGTSKFDLAFEIESSQAEGCFIEYADMFEPSTVEAMASDFELLLGALIQKPDLPLGELEEVNGVIRRLAKRRILGPREENPA